jgi:hypothetical protein
MVEKISIAEFSGRFSGGDCHLLGRVSFESRSMTVPASIVGAKWSSVLIFASRVRSETAEDNLQTLVSHFSNQMIPIQLNTSEPLEVAATLQSALGEFIGRAEADPAVIDITSFRREELLMLLALLKLKGALVSKHWHLAYVGAQNMGEWLSGKVTAHRSVLGYPGDIRPSRSTRVVVLMGFEIARARSIIETYEPKQLILGMGRKSESITDSLYERNKELFLEITREFRGSIEKEFEFSAREPIAVKRELEAVILPDDSTNVVIAPLHTKLSTIGVGLYGLEHSEAQVCYAPVEEYNEAAYSAPGRDIYLIPITSLF